MAVEFESPEPGKVAGVSMEFPASSSSSPMPRRLRRRLSEAKAASPSTVEEIEAKLRDADLRRQKFYESLARRARPKPRSPSQSSSQEEDLGQRLQARLQAAEQKRRSILAQAQMRLAKLDELRQAAKTGVEMRFKKQQAELSTKVDLRVQQAEANRMLILKANKQRRARLMERASQSLLRRMARENKYKECVRVAIHQKRLAAEKKRLGLLEKEKNRVRARILRVRKAAKYVSNQREMERKKMKDKLEDRLQRAKRHREAYLSQKSRQSGDLDRVTEQADNLSRKVARCWRRFVRVNKSTLALTKGYVALNINLKNVKSMPFEQIAILIESPASLQTVKALLDRFENRYKLLKPLTSTSNTSSQDDIDHLLKRVASPIKRATPMKSSRFRTPNNKRKSSGEAAKVPVKLSRYQARVVLCAYMILGHPDAVLSGNGEREIALAKSAEKFLQEFELLIRIVLDGPIKNPVGNSDPLALRFQLAAFDAAWCSYLNSFVMWKVKDAESLEEDLVRAACQLELSMIQTCKLTSDEDNGSLTHDMKAIQKQVTEDQKLLRDKVRHLCGEVGIQRMESALSDTRMKYFQARENGSPVGSPPPVAHIYSPSSSPDLFVSDSNGRERNEGSNPVVRSLFQDDVSSLPQKIGVSDPSSSSGRQIRTSGEKLVLENEVIVNEFLHEQHHSLAGSINVFAEDRVTKSKIKEMMEKAFWDSIIDSMKQNEPKYDQVVDLMREVRDEISEVAPRSWRDEISESIDPYIISQLLNSGKLDMDYFGKVLEFALITLQKLSTPASEDELKVAHQNLLKELAEICQAGDGSHHSCGVALIKGLRFVLEQIQALKREISKARIKIVEPLLRGPAGLDYLRNAFANHYGFPSDALTALPLTFTWLSSVWGSKDQEWLEHTCALSELASRGHESSPLRVFPSALRTGGSTLASRISGISKKATELTEVDDKLPECKGEKVDLSVRLGLLKLVSRVSGLTEEALPETMKLNLVRLRGVQAEHQKTLVVCTSILVLRQILLGEQMVQNTADMENILTSCSKQLSELFDSVGDAGIKEIIEILVNFFKNDQSSGPAKIESLMNVMARMLTKSLQAGDPVFVRVSRALSLAMRGVVLGGARARELAEVALRQVGAVALVDRVVETSKVLVVVATVSCGVHGDWYAHLVRDM